jgi:hypothetical protein
LIDRLEVEYCGVGRRGWRDGVSWEGCEKEVGIETGFGPQTSTRAKVRKKKRIEGIDLH